MIAEKEWNNLVERYETSVESKAIARSDEDKYQSYANRLARKYSGLKKGSLVEIKGTAFKVTHVVGELVGSDLRISVWGDSVSTFNFSELLLLYCLSEGIPEHITITEK